MSRPLTKVVEHHGAPSPTRARRAQKSVRGESSIRSSWRSRGLIRLGEAATALQQLRARMSTRELCSDDLPAAYVRLLYALPEDAPIISRVDQLATENLTSRTPS